MNSTAQRIYTAALHAGSLDELVELEMAAGTMYSAGALDLTPAEYGKLQRTLSDLYWSSYRGCVVDPATETMTA